MYQGLIDYQFRQDRGPEAGQVVKRGITTWLFEDEAGCREQMDEIEADVLWHPEGTILSEEVVQVEPRPGHVLASTEETVA
jgi:hypothetical protein